MTTKAIMVGMLSVALAACAGRPAIQSTPAERAQAVGIAVCGGSVRDVATELSISEDEARELVRSTARELMKWVQRSYDRPPGARRAEGARVASAPGQPDVMCPID